MKRRKKKKNKANRDIVYISNAEGEIPMKRTYQLPIHQKPVGWFLGIPQLNQKPCFGVKEFTIECIEFDYDTWVNSQLIKLHNQGFKVNHPVIKRYLNKA